VLDAFSKIAPELYEQFADADLDGPRAELDNIVTRYFHMEIGELI
jgi:hypothetical protein